MFSTEDFGHKGKVYDGWETRRRREAGHDWAIVRLGVPGVVHGVVVDTAWFKGNYPPHDLGRGHVGRGLSVGRRAADGRLGDPGREVAGQGRHRELFDVGRPAPVHPRAAVRSTPTAAWPGFRVHGEVGARPAVPHAAPSTWPALENGGRLVDSSDAFYSLARTT